MLHCSGTDSEGMDEKGGVREGGIIWIKGESIPYAKYGFESFWIYIQPEVFKYCQNQ